MTRRLGDVPIQLRIGVHTGQSVCLSADLLHFYCRHALAGGNQRIRISLGRRRRSSPRQCYQHSLRTFIHRAVKLFYIVSET